MGRVIYIQDSEGRGNSSSYKYLQYLCISPSSGLTEFLLVSLQPMLYNTIVKSPWGAHSYFSSSYLRFTS